MLEQCNNKMMGEAGGELTRLIVLNNAIEDFLYDSPRRSRQSIFDTLLQNLLWAEKEQPSLIENIISVGIIQRLFTVPHFAISAFTTVFCNCSGPLLHAFLPHGARVLELYAGSRDFTDENDALQLVANYIKVYHRHWNPSTTHLFIQNNKCVLLAACIPFYNCSQELNKTSILNVIMTLLKDNLFPAKILSEWALSLCRLFRNELNSLDKQLIICEKEQQTYIINVIIDKIVLWEDLSEISIQLFKDHFAREVMEPLLIGSLNVQEVPLFSLKFAIFMLSKLTKVMFNLDLLQRFFCLLFLENKIYYYQSSLNTSIQKNFNWNRIHQSILTYDMQKNENIYHSNSQQQLCFEGVQIYFTSILKSKDNRFLELSINLLCTILMQARIKEQVLKQILDIGFQNHGRILLTLSQLICQQILFTHSLNTITYLCSILSSIQPFEQWMENIVNILSHTTSIVVKQAIERIKNKINLSLMLQTYEYDYKIVDKMTFTPNIKQDKALLFKPFQFQNQSKQFYQQIPQNDQTKSRYIVVKSLILNKMIQKTKKITKKVSNYQNKKIKQNEIEIGLAKPGSVISIPTQKQFVQCIIKQKQNVPAILISDEMRFLIGYAEPFGIRIIINVPFKHVVINKIQKKRERPQFKIFVSIFDPITQQLSQISNMKIQSQTNLISYLALRKANFHQKELQHVQKTLKNLVQALPQISLI